MVEEKSRKENSEKNVATSLREKLVDLYLEESRMNASEPVRVGHFRSVAMVTRKQLTSSFCL